MNEWMKQSSPCPSLPKQIGLVGYEFSLKRDYVLFRVHFRVGDTIGGGWRLHICLGETLSALTLPTRSHNTSQATLSQVKFIYPAHNCKFVSEGFTIRTIYHILSLRPHWLRKSCIAECATEKEPLHLSCDQQLPWPLCPVNFPDPLSINTLGVCVQLWWPCRGAAQYNDLFHFSAGL